MVALGHIAVGVIVGVTAYRFLGQGDLASGLLITGAAAIVSHYLTDFFPHGHYFLPKDYHKWIKLVIIFDVVIPIILILSLIYLQNGFGEKLLYLFFSIGGAQLPDVLDGLIYTKVLKAKNILKIENNFHQRLHWHG